MTGYSRFDPWAALAALDEEDNEPTCVNPAQQHSVGPPKNFSEFSSFSTDAENFRNFECSLVQWLESHFVPSSSDYCAWCKVHADRGEPIVPFGTTKQGHVWLHHRCWPDWNRWRREKAVKALTDMGISPPDSSGDSVPDDSEHSDFPTIS